MICALNSLPGLGHNFGFYRLIPGTNTSFGQSFASQSWSILPFLPAHHQNAKDSEMHL
jgi:hypothetical protein